MNAIVILWLRQLKRYARSRSRMLGMLGQPILFLVALGFGLGPTFARAGEGDYLQFIAPGVIAMSILFTAVFSGIEIVWDRQFGFLKETLVAPVPRTAIVLGRILGGATVALLQGCIVFLITLLIGFRPESLALLPLAFVYMALIALLFSAFGTALACVLEDMQAFPIIMNFLVMPLFFLSGALFPFRDLPWFIDLLTKLDPLSYGVDGLHGAMLGTLHFGFVVDAGVLLSVTLALLVLSSFLFSRMEA